MTQPPVPPFTRPMRALRRAAWGCALKGNPVQWNDPAPSRDTQAANPSART
jgi:hypothetical protein